MKTRYFRRKQNSDAVEWIEMSGAEYLDFVRDPENKDRFFLNMKNVVLECSKEEYLQSRTEKRRSDYLAESKKGWTIISLFAQADKESTGEEVIPDPDADVEENILHTLAVQRVREVVDALPEEDAALLRALYLQTPPLTPVCLQRENRNPGDDAALQKRKAASAFEAANLSQVL